MGFLRWGWLKKDKSMVKSNRRQSEPPLSTINFDPNSNRESYLKALDEFQERRNQPTDSSNICSETLTLEECDGHIYATINKEPGEKSECSYNTKSAHTTTTEENDYLESNNTSKNSLPQKNEKFDKRLLKKKEQTNTINNSIIFGNEVKEFEIKHCRNYSAKLDKYSSYGVNPPAGFFKESSNPYPKSPKYKAKTTESYQRGCVVTTNNTQSKRSNAKVSPQSNVSGCYKNYDINYSSTTDEHEKLKSFTNKNIQKDTKYIFQINKHGESVEYVVPDVMESRLSTEDISLQNSANLLNCGGVIDGNSTLNDYQGSFISRELPAAMMTVIDPIYSKITTDLDASIAGIMPKERSILKRPEFSSQDDVCNELRSLEAWSNTLEERNNSFNINEKFVSKITSCKPKDIKRIDNMLFGNRFTTELEFSRGMYRKTVVTLRKCNPIVPETVRLTEEAIERDYDILRSSIRHPNIVMLMAASYNKNLINHMILVLESTDCTLNYYLHKINDRLSIYESLSIVKQIADATQYLHEFGYIHSNISSHCILICNQNEQHLAVKLSSFELVTRINTCTYRDIESMYGLRDLDNISDDSSIGFVKYNQKSLKAKYREMSAKPPMFNTLKIHEHSYLNLPSEFLPYNRSYRQYLSLYNYQAPELLDLKQMYVLPSIRSDIYGICLLMWEILNQCVPYAIYSQMELEQMFAKRQAYLPIFEAKWCHFFINMFVVGLDTDQCKRYQNMEQFITELNVSIARMGSPDLSTYLDHTNYEGLMNVSTNKPLIDNPKKFTSTLFSSIEKTDMSSTDCTVSQSMLEFDKCLLEPIVGNERTSTLKRRKKIISNNTKVPNKEPTYSNPNTENNIQEKLNNDYANNKEGNIKPEISDTKKSAEVIGPLKVKENILPTKMCLTHEKNQFLNNFLLQPKIINVEIEKEDIQISNPVNNFLGNGMPITKIETNDIQKLGHRFVLETTSNKKNKYLLKSSSQGDTNLTPTRTPIAFKNKIRRNAWLSNEKYNIQGNIAPNNSSDLLKNKKDFANVNTSNEDHQRINFSIKIVHNKVTPTTAKDSIEQCNALTHPDLESQKIQRINNKLIEHPPKADVSSKPLYFDKRNLSPTKLNESKSGQNENSNPNSNHKCINDKSNVTSNSILEDILEKQKTMKLNVNGTSDHNWKRERELCTSASPNRVDNNEIDSTWTPVKDIINQFENRRAKSSLTITPISSPQILENISTSNLNIRQFTKELPTHRPYSEDMFLRGRETLVKRTIFRESIMTGVDLADSAQKQSTGKKLTTYVTLNMRKTQIQTPNDLIQVSVAPKKHTEQSFGSNKVGILEFNLYNSSNKFNSGCSSHDDEKLLCLNCSSSMPKEDIEKLLGGKTSNHIGNLAQSNLAFTITDRLMDDSVNKCSKTPHNIRSTEDFYIDDDYSHGGRGANIELLADSSEFFDVGYNI